MARIKRYQLADVSYLVSQRGHNRLPCFYDGEDYLTFVEALKRLSASHGCELHSWSLIPDGYWILLTPSTATGVSGLMQTLGRLYVRYVNRKYGRTGTVWSSRYRACLIEPDSAAFNDALRFIDTAAYRNLVVEEEDQWPWQAPTVATASREDEEPIFLSIEAALSSGLAYGSAAFLQNIETTTTLRTTPLKRGRPHKLKLSESRPA